MSTVKQWIFRILILIGAALVGISWVLDWWSCYIVEVPLDRAVVIHPYGLEDNLGEMSGFIQGAAMPGFFAPLMWAYLVVCIVVLLFSLFAKDKEVNLLGKFKLSLPQLLIGLVGFSYIIVCVVAVIFAQYRMTDFYDMKLIGTTEIILGYPLESDVEANLKIGYWLACVSGIYLILLALVRNKFTGKS